MENLKTAAKKIQEKGTGGDTILAHINPHEAAVLKAMGGAGTTNPETGLPEYKKFWKRITIQNIVKAAPIIIAVAAPEIAPFIGESLGFTGAAATTAGNAVISATASAAQGKSPEEIAKSAVASVAGSTIGGAVGEAAGGGVTGSTVGGAAGGATQAAITGQDPLKGALIGGTVGGVKSGVTEALTPGPSTTPADLGVPSSYGQGFDVMTEQTPAQVAAANPDLYPGGKLPSAGQETVFTPSGQSYYQDVSPFAKAAGQVAGQVAGQTLGSSLYESPTQTPSSTSALSSTGLFTPQSIVPTALTGVSPVARGKPILGGEDEESSGAWGAKTLRG